MDKINVKGGGWVVVCDGRKALILKNIGDQAFPNLRTKEIREHKERRTSAQGSNAPGRVHHHSDLAAVTSNRPTGITRKIGHF